MILKIYRPEKRMSKILLTNIISATTIKHCVVRLAMAEPTACKRKINNKFNDALMAKAMSAI